MYLLLLILILLSYFIFSVEPGTKPHAQPKFVVFYNMLMSLFTILCFKCKSPNPTAELRRNGTMATITQICKQCKPKKAFTWRSQPLVLGKHPAGNVMMSFGILMSGISISQVIVMFKHMNLSAISLRTYFLHQSKFLFPSVFKLWKATQTTMVEKLKERKQPYSWSGDGRFDSMGHSAKYGVYSMFSKDTSKVVHFELLQVNIHILIVIQYVVYDKLLIE